MLTSNMETLNRITEVKRALAEGRSRKAIAALFCISERYVGTIARGDSPSSKRVSVGATRNTLRAPIEQASDGPEDTLP